MVFPFGKKKEEEAEPAPMQNYVPTDMVQRMASQGMSEPEMISRLRREGFTPSQINDALRSQIKREVAPRPMEMRPRGPMDRPQQAGTTRPPMPPPMSRGPEPMGMAPPQRMEMPSEPMPLPPRAGEIAMPERQPMPEQMQAPPMPQREVPRFRPPERVVGPGMGAPRRFEEAPSPQQMFTYERGPETEDLGVGPEEITLEELIEGIVSDKWDEFEDRLGNFEKRDLQLQAQIEDMRKKMSEMDKMLKDRESTYIGKLDEFGDSMESIDGRISSIEKVFKETIQELSQSIRALSEHTEKLKEKEEK